MLLIVDQLQACQHLKPIFGTNFQTRNHQAGSGNYVKGEYVMQIAKFEITGIGSILMRNPAGMQVCTKYERGGKTIPEPVDEARRSLYANPSTGQLYIKSDCFREAALIAAADVRDPTRKGRATMTRRFSAGVFLAEEQCMLYRASNAQKPITNADEDWEVDLRRVVVQKNGIIRARPKISGWQCHLLLEYDEQIIQPELIAAILDNAGRFPGILDYRIGKKGTFGRFSVCLKDA